MEKNKEKKTGELCLVWVEDGGERHTLWAERLELPLVEGDVHDVGVEVSRAVQDFWDENREEG